MSIWATPPGEGEPLGLSVGELLMDADAASRQLLVEAREEDTPAMLRTWPEVVEAAERLWMALPFDGPAHRNDAVAMQRLATATRAVHRSIAAAHWPGAGPGDCRLEILRDVFDRAHDLVQTRRQDLGPAGIPRSGAPRTTRDADAFQADAFQADVSAARARIMHVLYVGVHAVGRTTGEHADALRGEQARSTRPWTTRDTGAITLARKLVKRLATLEHAAGSYVAQGRYPQRLTGEQAAPADGADRLGQAVARWDLQAHRTLAADRSTDNLALVCHVQATIATELAVVVDAALATGTLQAPQFTERMAPALDATHRQWAGAARRWSTLSGIGAHPDPALIHAAQELRTACRTLTRHGLEWAAPELLAARADPGQIAQHLQQGLSAGLNLAHMIRDTAAGPEVTGPARALQEWIHRIGAPPPGTDPDRAWVPARAIVAGRRLPLPPPVRQDLTVSLDTTVAAAEAAMSASMWLDLPGPQTARDLGAVGIPARHPRGVQQRLPVLDPDHQLAPPPPA